MKTKLYKICSHQYINEYGVGDKKRYFIKYRHKTIFGKYWKAVKHNESISTCEVGKVTTYFNDINDCKKFIFDVLMKNQPKDKWVISEEFVIYT